VRKLISGDGARKLDFQESQMFSRLCWLGIILVAVLGPGSSLAVSAQGLGWMRYESERYGFSFTVPSALLRLKEQPADGNWIEFISADSRTKLKVLSTYNQDGLSTPEYKDMILRELPGVNVEYEPAGRSWFVLSGVRGPNIYYQKVMFTCGGRVITAFSMTYPEEEKRGYDSVVTAIEKSFRPASGSICRG
jgi:hypothetical protein